MANFFDDFQDAQVAQAEPTPKKSGNFFDDFQAQATAEAPEAKGNFFDNLEASKTADTGQAIIKFIDSLKHPVINSKTPDLISQMGANAVGMIQGGFQSIPLAVETVTNLPKFLTAGKNADGSTLPGVDLVKGETPNTQVNAGASGPVGLGLSFGFNVSGKDAPEFLLKNPAMRALDKAHEALDVRSRKFKDETLFTLIDKANAIAKATSTPEHKKFADYSKAREYMGLTIAENLPQTLGTAAAALYGVPSYQLLGALSAISAGQKYAQLTEQSEARVRSGKPPLEKANLLLDSVLSGSIDGFSEVVGGTVPISKFGAKMLSDLGLQTTKEAFTKIMTVIGLSSGVEGMEEYFASVGQDMVDNMTRLAPTPTGQWSSSEIQKHGIEAGLFGSILGGGVGGLSTSVSSLKMRGMQQKAFEEITPSALSKMSPKDKQALLESLPERYAKLVEQRALDPKEVLELMEDPYAKARFIEALPKEIRDKFEQVIIRQEDLDQQRKTFNSQTKAPPEVVDYASLDEDPTAHRIKDAKAMVEADKAYNIKDVDYIAKRQVVKDKLGIDISDDTRLPATLRKQLLGMNIDEMRGKTPAQLSEEFKNELYFFVGDTETKDWKLSGFTRVTDKDGAVHYKHTIFQQGDGPEPHGPIKSFTDSLDNEQLSEEFTVWDDDVERGAKVSAAIKEAQQKEKARRRIKTESPSEQAFRSMHQVTVAQAAAQANQQTAEEKTQTVEGSIAVIQQKTGMDKMRATLAKANERVRLTFAGQIDAQKYGESIRGNEKFKQALNDREKELTKQINPLGPRDVRRLELVQERQLIKEALGEANKKVNESLEALKSTVAEIKSDAESEAKKTAYDLLKEKLGPRGGEVVGKLAEDKLPSELHTKTRKQFWKNYDDAKEILKGVYEKFAKLIEIVPSSNISVRMNSDKIAEKRAELIKARLVNDADMIRKLARELNILMRKDENPKKGLIEIHVGAKARVGSSIATSKIIIDNATLRNNYNLLKQGRLRTSKGVEALSTDTFDDFQDPAGAYAAYALAHEQVHILLGIDSTIMDENLAKILALELVRDKVNATGKETPVMDLEIARILDVMANKIKGHIPGLPWRLDPKSTTEYVVSYYDLSLKRSATDRAAGRDQGSAYKGFDKLTQDEIALRAKERYEETESGDNGFKSDVFSTAALIELHENENVEIVNVVPNETGIKKGELPNTFKPGDRIGELAYIEQLSLRLNESGKRTSKTESDTSEPVEYDEGQSFDVVADDKNMTEQGAALWAQTEEGQKVLKENQEAMDTLRENTREYQLYNALLDFLEEYDSQNAEGGVFESPLLEKVGGYLASPEGAELLRDIRDGKVKADAILSLLPEELRTMLTSTRKALDGDWTKDRGLDTPTELPEKLPSYSAKAPTKRASAYRKAWEAVVNVANGHLGFVHMLWSKVPANTINVINGAGKEDADMVFKNMHPNARAYTESRILNAMNDMFKRMKLTFQTDRSMAEFVAWHAGSEITWAVYRSIIKNTPNLVTKLPDGSFSIPLALVKARLNMMWKSMEEVRVTSMDAISNPTRVVKTLVGQGRSIPSETFLRNNKDVLAGATVRPELFYWNQLHPEEQQAVAFASAEITRVRDQLINAGHFTSSDIYTRATHGYYPALSSKSEETRLSGPGGSSFSSDFVSSELHHDSIDADDFEHRAKNEQKFDVADNAATATARYLYDGMKSLTNSSLANAFKQWENPLIPMGLPIIMYKSTMVDWLKKNGWRKHESKENDKSYWIKPEDSDPIFGEGTGVKKNIHELHQILEALGYSENPGYQALRNHKGNRTEEPWMPKKTFEEFEWFFKNEFGDINKIERYVSRASFLSKLMIMYSPFFQLYQVGSSFVLGMMLTNGNDNGGANLQNIFKSTVASITNDPEAFFLPVKRQPFSTLAPRPGGNLVDEVTELLEAGVATVSASTVFQEISDYEALEPFLNPNKSAYSQTLQFLTPFSRNLWETWIGGMSKTLYFETKADFMRRGFPEPMAKRLAGQRTNLTMNFPGKYIHGREGSYLNILLFAREFTFTMARYATGALGLTGEGLATMFGSEDNAGNKVMRRLVKSAFWGELLPSERKHMQQMILRQLTVGTMLGVSLIQLMNLAATALFSKEKRPLLAVHNPVGKKGSVFMGYDQRGNPLYMKIPIMQEFTTMQEFMPESFSLLGMGKGQDAVLSRLGVLIKIFANWVNNTDPTDRTRKNFKPNFGSQTDGLMAWIEANYKLLSIAGPDFARPGQDRNKTLDQYLLQYFTGINISKSVRGDETPIFIGRAVISPSEFRRFTNDKLTRVRDANLEISELPEADLANAIINYRKYFPGYELSAANAVARRDQDVERAQKIAAMFSELKRIQPSELRKAGIKINEPGILEKLNLEQLKKKLKASRERKEN